MIRKLALTAALCLAATSAWADNEADFTLANATGYPIAELYVSPSGTKAWGPDVLGKKTMGNGEAWKITFPRASDNCVHDVQIVFEDDNSKVVWEKLDLCEINKLTLTYNRGTGVTTATKE